MYVYIYIYIYIYYLFISFLEREIYTIYIYIYIYIYIAILTIIIPLMPAKQNLSPPTEFPPPGRSSSSRVLFCVSFCLGRSLSRGWGSLFVLPIMRWTSRARNASSLSELSPHREDTSYVNVGEGLREISRSCERLRFALSRMTVSPEGLSGIKRGPSKSGHFHERATYIHTYIYIYIYIHIYIYIYIHPSALRASTAPPEPLRHDIILYDMI